MESIIYKQSDLIESFFMLPYSRRNAVLSMTGFVYFRFTLTDKWEKWEECFLLMTTQDSDEETPVRCKLKKKNATWVHMTDGRQQSTDIFYTGPISCVKGLAIAYMP